MEWRKDMIIGQKKGKKSRSKIFKIRGRKKSRENLLKEMRKENIKIIIYIFNTTHPDLEKNVMIFSMHTQTHTHTYF